MLTDEQQELQVCVCVCETPACLHMQILQHSGICVQTKEEDYSRNPRPKLLKEVQEAKKHISRLQEQLSEAASQVKKNNFIYTSRRLQSAFGDLAFQDLRQP